MPTIRISAVKTVMITCIVTCLSALIFYLYRFHEQQISTDTGQWAAFGDYLSGVLGTILSFFTILLVYITYVSQVETSTLQQFETTFFSLLQNQRDIFRFIKGEFQTELFGDKTEEYVADDYIKAISLKIDGYFDGKSFNLYATDGDIVKTDTDDFPEIQHIIDLVTDSVLEGRQGELGRYFRHLYHLVKYVDESYISDKKKYVDIIQSQCSDDELHVLFYYSISTRGRDYFQKYFYLYSFFRDVSNRGPLFDRHRQIFFPNT